MATFSSDPNSRTVLFNDGEPIEEADLNLAQLTFRRQLMDDVLSAMIPDTAASDPDDPTTAYDLELGGNYNGQLNSNYTEFAFAPSPGAGYWGIGASANQITFRPGPLVMPFDDPSGPVDVAAPAVRLGGYGGVSLTTAVGDATNPRIDVVEMKVEFENGDSESRDFEDASTRVKSTTTPNKSRRTKVTYQIKQGTPAAVPAYPAPSAGFRAVAAVWIPANHNSNTSPSNIRDLRLPLGGVRTYDVNSSGFMFGTSGTKWGLDNLDALSPGGAAAMYAPCPVQGRNARLLGIGLYGSCAGGAECWLVKLAHDGSGLPTETVLAKFDSDLFDTAGYRQIGLAELMDYVSGDSGSLTPSTATIKGTRAPGTFVGTGIWLSGDAPGPADPRVTLPEATCAQLALRVNGNNGSLLSLVRWFVAHGM